MHCSFPRTFARLMGASALTLAHALSATPISAQPTPTPRAPSSAAVRSATGTASGTAPTPRIANDEFARRRAALAAALPGDGALLAIGESEPEKDYLHFFQSSNFLYLTGVREPDAMLLGIKQRDTTRWVVFVQPREPSREVWTGRRVGPDAALETWGVAGRTASELATVLDSLAANGVTTLHLVADQGMPSRPTPADQFVSAFKAKYPAATVKNASGAVLKLRAYKSDAELALIKRATDITVQAHRDAARAISANGYEYEVQADLERVFRKHGADRPSFASIIGSGPNATTLHYNANNRQMKAGEMVVVDIGASYDGYAADMTRSYPVNGVFTAEQRAVYQVVRDAQAAAERQAKAGRPARGMSDSASAVLAAGLTKLGLIEAPDATYDCSTDGATKCRQLSLFYMHGLGHGIGLEVHDPDRYSYDDRTLQPGSVFTIEPGIYVRENVLDILPKTPRNAQLVEKIRAAVTAYRNIGVRIEDDYIVTANGLEWITKSPREIAEIEAMMKKTRM